jgi:hypothetical protein
LNPFTMTSLTDRLRRALLQSQISVRRVTTCASATLLLLLTLVGTIPAHAQDPVTFPTFSYHWRTVVDGTPRPPVLGYIDGEPLYFANTQSFPIPSVGSSVCFSIQKEIIDIPNGLGGMVTGQATTWRIRFSTSDRFPCSATYSNIDLTTPTMLYSGTITIAITNTPPGQIQTNFNVPIGQTTIIPINSVASDADGDPVFFSDLGNRGQKPAGCGAVTARSNFIAFTPSSSGGICEQRISFHDTVAYIETVMNFISPGVQTITFTSTAPTSAQAGGANYTVAATASSNLAVAFSLDATSTGCTLAGSTVAFTGAGTCRINANQAGNGSFQPAPQVQQSFTVAAAAQNVALNAVQSRKTHGAAGTFDLLIDTAPLIAGSVTVEPRIIGAGHSIVFQFNQAVTSIGSVSAVDTSGNPIGVASGVINSANTNEVIVTLTGVADASRVTIAVNSVAGTGNTLNQASASMGFLVGDVNNSRSVSNTDITALKTRAGQTLNNTNFKYDVDVSGGISNTDISAAKTRVGAGI